MMKILVLGLIVIISKPVLSVVNFKTVKLADGAVAVCNTWRDTVSMRNRSGIYRAQTKSVEVIDYSTIKVSIGLDFLECSRSGRSLGFSYKSPYAVIKFEDRELGGTVRNINITPLEVRFTGYKDGVYKLLFDKRVINTDSGRILLSVTLPLNSIIDQDDKKRLENGDEIIGNFDFWISKKMNWDNLNDNSACFIDVVRYGAYRTFVKLQMVNGMLKAKL